MARTYVTYYPRLVEFNDDSRVIIREDEASKGVIKLFVSPTNIERLKNFLVEQGFTVLSPPLTWPKGKQYSLSKPLKDDWELHLRIYSNGIVEAEVEISREYLEHRQEYRHPVLYEATPYIEKCGLGLHVFHAELGKWVIGVPEHYQVVLRHPKQLTPWKPILVIGIIVGALGLASYTLSRLEAEKERPPHPGD